MGSRYFLTFLISAVVFLLQCPSIEMAKFNIFQKTIRCYDLNQKLLANISCRLKVTRQVPTGLIQLKGDAFHIDNVFLRLTIFYRYTGGFRPYIVDVTVNACDLAKQSSFFLYNPALNRMAMGMKIAYPRLFDGCPYNGHYESRFFDVNATFSHLLPPIVAEGRYKFLFHVYTAKKETIMKFESQTDFKASKEFRAMDFSMLNMG